MKPKPPTSSKPRKFKYPNLKKAWLSNLWYENDKGDRRAVTKQEMRTMTAPSVKKWPYALSRFPNEVTTKLYKRRPKDGFYSRKDLIGEWRSTANDEKLVLSIMHKGYRLYEAICIVSQACERCHNLLARNYAMNSEEAKRCNTSCNLCK